MADDSSLNAPGLTEYFRDLVREAFSKRRCPLRAKGIQDPEAIEFYLVNLLKESVMSADQEPLALLYLRAARAEVGLRVKLLKRLGDFSLFITGFFPESLSRQIVDVDYYVQMGESAYGSLSTLLARRSALAGVFAELAGRFVSYMDILSEVSEKTSARKDRDLLRLYELWLRTGSRRAAGLLASEGIHPLSGPLGAFSAKPLN